MSGAHLKSWGPFTGRQLTTILCVLAVILLLPVSSWAAVSFTNVAITDPGGVNRAKVDATGALAVAGAVTATPALPTKPIVIQTTQVGFNATTKLFGPVSTAFGITSLTIDNYACKTSSNVVIQSGVSTGGIYTIYRFSVPAGGSLQLAFPTPSVTTPPPGGRASLYAELGGGCAVVISGVGLQS